MAAAAAVPTAQMIPDQPQPASTEPPPQEERPEMPRPYKCTMCDKAFHRLEHQTRHIRTHTGEKPHACMYPGCAKRFSRSDELTRHSRIHNNPNSRRGKQQSHHAAVAAAMHGASYPDHHMAHVMQPPPIGSYSGHSSGVSSPNISPPHLYSQPTGRPSQHSSPYGSFNGTPDGQHYHRQQYAPSMNLLADAATRAAEHDGMSSYPSIPTHGPSHQTHHPSHPYHRSHTQPNESQQFSARNGLAAYHYSHQPTSHPPSQPMSRTHSQDEGDHHAHRAAKRSRPGSPFSTNPPSPTFSSTDSISPTPGHTPAMTPAHSPRLRPHKMPAPENHLPGIRDLSLAHMHSPALEPLEPSTQASGTTTPHHPYSRSQNNSSAGLRIADIMNQPDGSDRKLPLPAVSASETDLPSLRRPSDDAMEY